MCVLVAPDDDVLKRHRGDAAVHPQRDGLDRFVAHRVAVEVRMFLVERLGDGIERLLVDGAIVDGDREFVGLSLVVDVDRAIDAGRVETEALLVESLREVRLQFRQLALNLV